MTAPDLRARSAALPAFSFLPALLLGLGVTAGGALAGAGVARVRTGDRTVTVRGVSEREARADLAIWPLRLSATDDDLPTASAALAGSVARVRAFLAANGLAAAPGAPGGTEVTVQDFTVTDARSNQGTYAPGSRFVIRQTLVLRSADVARVQAASQRVGELVQDGVVLTSGQEYGGGGPTFLFTKLNDLKPPMIAEATARAREGAQQFARDSRSTLAGIREGSQGVFEILPRDQAPGINEGSQLVKTVRVVTTVTYGLRD